MRERRRDGEKKSQSKIIQETNLKVFPILVGKLCSLHTYETLPYIKKSEWEVEAGVTSLLRKGGNGVEANSSHSLSLEEDSVSKKQDAEQQR